MNIFEYTKAYRIDYPVPEPIEMIRLKYARLLNLFNFVTGSDSNGISFKRKQIVTGSYNYEYLKPFREGYVAINYNIKQLEIIWTVKLDFLYLISFLFSIAFGIMAELFFDLPFPDLIIVGLVSFVLFFFIGISSIILKISEINITCLEEQQNS